MPLRLGRPSSGETNADTRPLCKPLSFHVYRIGGIWGDDKIVRADDRRTPRYYLKGTRLAARWQFALHVGGPNGVVVCHVTSSYLGPPLLATNPGPIRVIVLAGSLEAHSEAAERRVVQVRRGDTSSNGTYSFRGPDDTEYRWQPISRLWGTHRMECRDSQDQVAATYRITLFAISKDGELHVYEHARFMADLLVATCLAMRIPDH